MRMRAPHLEQSLAKRTSSADEGAASPRAATARSARRLRVATSAVAVAVAAPTDRVHGCTPPALRVSICHVTTPRDTHIALRLCHHAQHVDRHTGRAAQPSSRGVSPLLAPRLGVSADPRCRACPPSHCHPYRCSYQLCRRSHRQRHRRTCDWGAAAPHSARIGIGSTSSRALAHSTSVGVNSTSACTIAHRKPSCAHPRRACTFPTRCRRSHTRMPPLLAALVGVGRAALGEASFASCSGSGGADSATAAAGSSRGAAGCRGGAAQRRPIPTADAAPADARAHSRDGGDIA